MEAGDYGLTRRTCFVTRRFDVIAVAGVWWISWCVLIVVGHRVIYFQRTRPATSMRPACRIYLSINKERRPEERSDQGSFFPIGKKASS